MSMSMSMSMSTLLHDKEDDGCSALASSLSENYRRPRTEASESGDAMRKRGGNTSAIRDYMKTRGILLTMCFPGSCVIPFGSNHISGSWIHKDLGFHVIPTLHDSGAVGLLLDPSVANVNCLYPTDAASDGHDEEGCGPMASDPKYGSQGASKLNFVTRKLARRFITNYKTLNFGADTASIAGTCLDSVACFPKKTRMRQVLISCNIPLWGVCQV